MDTVKLLGDREAVEAVKKLKVERDAAVARANQLEREREERGPFFVRDMARLAGLPDDASMDAIYEALRAALARVPAEQCTCPVGSYDAPNAVHTDYCALAGIPSEPATETRLSLSDWMAAAPKFDPTHGGTLVAPAEPATEEKP